MRLPVGLYAPQKGRKAESKGLVRRRCYDCGTRFLDVFETLRCEECQYHLLRGHGIRTTRGCDVCYPETRIDLEPVGQWALTFTPAGTSMTTHSKRWGRVFTACGNSGYRPVRVTSPHGPETPVLL